MKLKAGSPVQSRPFGASPGAAGVTRISSPSMAAAATMRSGANRIFRAAVHSKTALQLDHVLLQVRLSFEHFRRRIPVRPFLLGVDGRDARPAKSFAADPDAVTHGLSAGQQQIEVVTSRIDDDCSGRFARGISDQPAGERWIRLAALLLRCGDATGQTERESCGQNCHNHGMSDRLDRRLRLHRCNPTAHGFNLRCASKPKINPERVNFRAWPVARRIARGQSDLQLLTCRVVQTNGCPPPFSPANGGTIL